MSYYTISTVISRNRLVAVVLRIVKQKTKSWNNFLQKIRIETFVFCHFTALIMLGVVASVDHITFDIENAIEQQIGTQPLPFPGMDKSNAAVCTFFQHHSCTKGNMCPFRHVRGEKQIVCKHWLRGLCKKGDECEFLHQYDMTKMPECFFFSRFGMCNNKECPFLHIDPDSKIKDCPWYDRGFCKHGPSCKNRHVRRVMCQNYLNGFCLDGPGCKFQHPKFDNLISTTDYKESLKKLICHFCGLPGHKVMHCPSNPNAVEPKGPKQGIQVLGAKDTNIKSSSWSSNSHHHHHHTASSGHDDTLPKGIPRNKDHIKCYRCGHNGHIAANCTQMENSGGNFLSNNFPS